MPFQNQIIEFINDTLKAGSLNIKKLQPAKFYGLATVIARSKSGSKDPNKVEQLPAVVTDDGKMSPITADSKYAVQIYHKLLNNVYSYDKKSYGEGHYIKSVSELSMVVFSNSKLTGKTKDVLEPVVLFGIPQKLSTALMADLKINSCLITPVASNMDAIQVFRQEYPQSELFINEQMSMFLIRYKIEMVFSQACVEKCLCD
ncbi:MAG: hypothetical protein JWO92_1108 [Chitinophagaceae bacterium]|nr:hypothetical protein [Chitinophagaceae bacterium]